MTYAACITTYNEVETIAGLICQLRSENFAVYVADAGSTDDTADIAYLEGAEVLCLDHKLPIGPSMRAAWGAALDDDHHYIVQLDAGSSHDPMQAHQLTDALGRWHNANMVIGSRFIPGSVYQGGKAGRKRLSWLFAKFLNLRHGTNYSDWTSGYRAFSASLLKVLIDLPYQAKMHGWQIEVLRAAIRAEARIVETPIWYAAGRSSMNIRVALEALRVTLF